MTWPIAFNPSSSLIASSFLSLEEAGNPESAKDSVRYQMEGRNKKRKTFEDRKCDRRDSRSALAVNKLYQLVNDELLFTDYVFYQISNRYNSDQFALINNGKVANSLLSHNGHAFFHSLIKVSV
jgi:hypothetical protein